MYDWDVVRQAFNMHLFSDRDFIVMQFTGLEDKNNKEIYEGDIIVIIIDKTRMTGEVVFNKGMFRIESKKVNSSLWSELTAKVNDYVEVIGDIYRNPELIKGVKSDKV